MNISTINQLEKNDVYVYVYDNGSRVHSREFYLVLSNETLSDDCTVLYVLSKDKIRRISVMLHELKYFFKVQVL